MSLLNHSLNSSCESNRVGMIKCSKAHSCAIEAVPNNNVKRGMQIDKMKVANWANTNLGHAVLDWSACEQQPIATVEFQQSIPSHAVQINK